MAELGYQEGRNFTFEYIQAPSIEGYEASYRELLARKVNILLAAGNEQNLRAARTVAGTLPIASFPSISTSWPRAMSRAVTFRQAARDSLPTRCQPDRFRPERRWVWSCDSLGGRRSRRGTQRDDEVHSTADQISSEGRQPLGLAIDHSGPPPSDIRSSHCGPPRSRRRSSLGEVREADPPTNQPIHCQGIRSPASPAARSPQPASRRAAENPYEVAAFQTR
jgi:hypothetical protein